MYVWNALQATVLNLLKAWDVRKGLVKYQMPGHSDTVTSARLSPDGTHLLTFAMDNQVRMWDIRAFVTAQDRCEKVSGSK